MFGQSVHKTAPIILDTVSFPCRIFNLQQLTAERAENIFLAGADEQRELRLKRLHKKELNSRPAGLSFHGLSFHGLSALSLSILEIMGASAEKKLERKKIVNLNLFFSPFPRLGSVHMIKLSSP